jgi:hypothetical protein
MTFTVSIGFGLAPRFMLPECFAIEVRGFFALLGPSGGKIGVNFHQMMFLFYIKLQKNSQNNMAKIGATGDLHHRDDPVRRGVFAGLPLRPDPAPVSSARRETCTIKQKFFLLNFKNTDRLAPSGLFPVFDNGRHLDGNRAGREVHHHTPIGSVFLPNRYYICKYFCEKARLNAQKNEDR